LDAEVKDWPHFLAVSAQRIIGNARALKQNDMPSVLRDILGEKGQEAEEALRW
jgi:hypothetical protein